MHSQELALADVDELILRCREEQTKQSLSKAVLHYEIGTFYTAIVTTWITVVFDILSKLRELERMGNMEANNWLTRLKHVQEERDPKEAIRQAQEREAIRSKNMQTATEAQPGAGYITGGIG